MIFDPHELTGDASLNLVVVADRAGIPADIRGERAGRVCSRDALAQLAERVVGRVDRSRLVDALAGARGVPVLEAFGARLGALLVTLRQPETAAAQGATPERRAFLEHWLALDRVWLAGGLLAPTIAGPLLDGARRVLAANGCAVELHVAPQAPWAPLVGAARMAQPDPSVSTVVADLGGTSIRTGAAVVQDGVLVGIRSLTSLPAPAGRDAGSVESAVLRALAAAVDHLSPAERRIDVVASVAAYVAGNRVTDDGRSDYTGLGAASERLPAALEALARQRVSIRWVHDGTAAAAATADPGPAGVVTVGTWLGVGFTPVRGPILPLTSLGLKWS